MVLVIDLYIMSIEQDGEVFLKIPHKEEVDMDLKSRIRVIEDFPKAGISFKDVTTLLLDGDAYKEAIDRCIAYYDTDSYDVILGPESRGFIVGAPMSYATGKPFVPVRKKGKLPGETVKAEYVLEYGTDILEMHKDAIKPGQRVLIADDLLATGGTVEAIIKMVEEVGGVIAGCVFFMELTELKGRERLAPYRIEAIMSYDI